MGVPVEMPRPVARTIPNTHRIVAEHDGLAVSGYFRKVAEPGERLHELAYIFVVISRYRKDLLAANLLAVG